MISFLKDAYAFFLNVLDTLPPAWSAAIAGVFACLLLTQWAKQYLPARWTKKERSMAAEILGFSIGAAVIFMYDETPGRALHAALVGLGGPLCYRVVIAITSRKWPHIADALSQDTTKPC